MEGAWMQTYDNLLKKKKTKHKVPKFISCLDILLFGIIKIQFKQMYTTYFNYIITYTFFLYFLN